MSPKAITRDILLSFWKLHILHHAGVEPVNEQWILSELRRHGYEISLGTLSPLLKRMERLGWLRGKAVALGGRRTRRDYRLTAQGERFLELMREKIRELDDEIVKEAREV